MGWADVAVKIGKGLWGVFFSFDLQQKRKITLMFQSKKVTFKMKMMYQQQVFALNGFFLMRFKRLIKKACCLFHHLFSQKR